MVPLARHCVPVQAAFHCVQCSLARDLAAFAAAGYLPTRAAAFDLFPHTPHIETLIRLEPRTT